MTSSITRKARCPIVHENLGQVAGVGRNGVTGGVFTPLSMHGLRQLCPIEVLASAPGGPDSIRSTSVGGADLRKFQLGSDEHVPRVKPHAMTATSRLISPLQGQRAAGPGFRSVRRIVLSARGLLSRDRFFMAVSETPSYNRTAFPPKGTAPVSPTPHPPRRSSGPSATPLPQLKHLHPLSPKRLFLAGILAGCGKFGAVAIRTHNQETTRFLKRARQGFDGEAGFGFSRA
jgi:hypothetical protein